MKTKFVLKTKTSGKMHVVNFLKHFLAKTALANNTLFAGIVLANKTLFDRTVAANETIFSKSVIK